MMRRGWGGRLTASSSGSKHSGLIGSRGSSSSLLDLGVFPLTFEEDIIENYNCKVYMCNLKFSKKHFPREKRSGEFNSLVDRYSSPFYLSHRLLFRISKNTPPLFLSPSPYSDTIHTDDDFPQKRVRPVSPNVPSIDTNRPIPSFTPIRACIFDMDGLLIDSEDIYSECTNIILHEHGKPSLPWKIKAQLQGRPGPEVHSPQTPKPQ